MAIGKKFTILGQSCVIAVFAVFAALATAASSPVIVASDDFQSYSIGNLNGGNGGTGWAGAWAANNSVVQVVDPAVDLQENRAIAFTGNNDSAAKRTLSTALTGGVFVDFLFQFAGAVDDNDFLGLWFGDSQGLNGLHSIGPNIGLKGNCGNGCDAGSDFFVRAFGFDSNFFAASNLVENTTYKMFGHLYKSDPLGDYNRFDAWLNPTASEMLNLTTPDAVFSSNSSSDYSISSIDQIGFRSLNLDSGDSMKIDNLNIRAVTVPVLVALVPEPGSIALFGLALAGLGLSRRRKNS